MENPPQAELKNGIRVANFSSPHHFLFDDGTYLHPCDGSRSVWLSLDSREETKQHHRLPMVDVKISYQMSHSVEEEINRLELEDDIDIILVPLPVLLAMKDAGMAIGKCRVVRIADRVQKTACSDRFCI